ncbi:MAG: 4'-phosphopantetheinyl transferase superfamily protein [Taibaiella sp.]|nr:4'-phosphopantetheinyl transferase superfamily protein [Taibaiella sp.]
MNMKLGNDVIFLPAFREFLNAGFIRRVYRQEEIDYCEQFTDPVLHYASTFAAKEAVYKAVKQWDSATLLPWKKILITRNKIAGQPSVQLLADIPGSMDFSLSITHDKDYVWAATVCARTEVAI